MTDFDINSQFFEIVGQVNKDDLSKEERRVIREREDRKALQIQAETPQLSISELFRAMGESAEEANPDEPLTTRSETSDEPTGPQSAFPAPPTGPSSKGST